MFSQSCTTRCSTSLGPHFVVLLTLFVTFSVNELTAQGSARDYVADEANETVPADLVEDLEFESLNFSRGGRSTAVAGVPGDPLT